MQIIDDCRTAIKSPPSSAIEQRILYSRLRAYWSRCEYVLWNAIGIGLLYLFKDSLLNQYINRQQYHLNVIFHSIQCLAIIAYFITSLKDPGYVSFKKYANNDMNHAEEQQLMLDIISDRDEHEEIVNNADHHHHHDHHSSSQNKPKYIEVNDISNTKHKRFIVTDSIPEYNKHILIDKEFENSWPSNFCDQCNFIRPIRSKHCFFCGRCVAKFDHHCPLVGNCIAGGNYRYFIAFLLTQSVVVLWTFYMSINVLFIMNGNDDSDDRDNHHDITYKHSVIGWIFRILFFVIMFMFLFSIIGLTGFHLYLLSTNQTTMELMRPDSIDKYLYEEVKKKQEYDKKRQQNANQQEEKKNVNVNDEDLNYQYRFYGNVTSYRTYFDEGFTTNLQMVFKGIIKPEWMTPIQCKFIEIDIKDYSE